MRDINGSKPTNFPLDGEKLPFQIPCPDRPPRENLLKLGAMITNRIGLKTTVDDPEYWGLDGVLTDEMVDVALKMGVRKPKTLAQMVKLTGMEEGRLEKLLGEMSWLGLIEYNWENLDGKNPNHEKRYILPLFVPGSAEFLNMRRSQIDEHPEVAAFFERMTMLPLEKITPMVPPGGAGIGMHVIPVEKAIETEQSAIGLEKISYWLDKYEGKYAKSMCSCRASRDKLGEGCGDDVENWCIGVGDMADYIVETQRGTYITKEEALEIFKKAEDNGFVHQITNIDGEEKIFGICNCNVNVCNALRTSQLFNTPNMSRSAYVAAVESEKCVACGRCVENCPAGAVKLGQKLCTKDGYIEYPRQELPDEVKWGPEKWAIDYRDKNRINCYDTGTAPCKTACPAHIAVQGYLKLAAQGKYREALQLIKRENPFPAVCGRICNRRCEDACTRGTVDQAVAIDEVKRFIAQQDLDAETRFVPEKVIPKVDGEFSEKIAVIGGGNIAADVARTAVRCGAEKVTLYCLEGYDEMPMGEEDRSECEREGVEIYAGFGPKEITVEDGRAVSMAFVKCLRVKDDSGRFAPVYDESTVQVTPCGTVLYCIGQKPDWGTLLTGTAVELDGRGLVQADPVTYQTAEKDIFAGGDVYTGQKFAIDAIAAGKEGAVSLHRYVQGATLTIGRNRRQFIELDKKNALIAVDSYDSTPRQRIGYNDALRRTFKDERVAFTEEQVRAETARCLGCGASIVDPNKCIGCGVCTTKCAFDAIHLHRERPECSTMYKCEDKMKAILPYMVKREIKIKKAARRAKKSK